MGKLGTIQRPLSHKGKILTNSTTSSFLLLNGKSFNIKLKDKITNRYNCYH